MVTRTKRSAKNVSVAVRRHESRFMWLKSLALYIGLIGVAGIFVIGDGLENQLTPWQDSLLVAQQSPLCYCKIPGKKIVQIPASTCRKRGGKCVHGSP